MALPGIIAKVTIPDKEGEDNPYHTFRTMILSGVDVYQNYTITRGGPKGAYYDEQGTMVQEPTKYLEHIHACDSDKGKTGKLLASIRLENRFGEKHYIMDIYDRDFAHLVETKWGKVEYIKPKPLEKTGPLLSRK